MHLESTPILQSIVLRNTKQQVNFKVLLFIVVIYEEILNWLHLTKKWKVYLKYHLMWCDKKKVYFITLKILPSIHLAGSLQTSETRYWYNVNNGKICRKIRGHLVTNVIKSTIIEMYIAIIYHKNIDNIGVLFSLPYITSSSVLKQGRMY